MIRRVRASVLGALVALAVAALTGGAPPVAAQEPATRGPSLSLVSRPAWARPTDELQFAVATSGDPAATSVQVEVFSALDSVEELEESAEEDVGVRLSRTPPTPVAALPVGPDGARIVSLRVAPEPVDDLTTQLVEPGVHPVVISLLGPGGERLDEIRTPLVRLGDEDRPWEAPALAVLLDVDASPTLRPDGSRRMSALDRRRLVAAGELLAAHPDVDLTVAAVPDTVEALASDPDPDAAAVVEQLVGRDVVAAPYVRLPVDALFDEGLEGLVPSLVERGTAVLADRLQVEPRVGVWDGIHEVGQDGARLLRELGYAAVVTTGPEPDDEDDPELTDSGPRPIAGTDELVALVSDPLLSSEVAAPLDDEPDAAHVALARYLLRPVAADPGDEEGAGATTVLVRPGPLADRSVLAGLLGLLDEPDAPVRVGGLDLVDDAVDEPEDEGDEPLVEPVEWSPEPGPDLGAVGPRILRLAGRLESFDAMLADRSPRADDLRLQVATAVAADADADARVAAVAAVESALRAAFDGIVLTGQTDLNLTSRRGTLPVTVDNRNDFPVDVLVRVRSDRLDFPDGDVLPVTVGARDVLRIDVPVEARASGSVPVFVDLLSVDGGMELQSLRLNVRSTAVSGVGLVLSLGAVLVLGTWWVRHILATRRSRSEPSEGPVR